MDIEQLYVPKLYQLIKYPLIEYSWLCMCVVVIVAVVVNLSK